MQAILHHDDYKTTLAMVCEFELDIQVPRPYESQ